MSIRLLPPSEETVRDYQWLLDNLDEVLDNPDLLGKYIAFKAEQILDSDDDYDTLRARVDDDTSIVLVDKVTKAFLERVLSRVE